MDPTVLSTIHAANTAPTNESSPYANGMVDTNAPPPIVAMGDTNDTVPELDCSHLSTITVDSANEPHLHLNPEAPTGVNATPHLAMDRVGEPPPLTAVSALP
jgi:hypothetical protein